MSLRHVVRDWLNDWQSCRPDRVWDKVRAYEWVSFDVFDTLVKRDVNVPSDVFRIVSERIGWDGFYDARIRAEHEARRASKEEEVTFEEIYHRLAPPSGTPKEDLMHEEVECELQLCHANPALLPTYEQCVRSGKGMVIVSDMYLPERVVEAILERSGIGGYQYLYLSSSERLTKTGGLFGKVVADLGVAPDNVVHVGNSFRGDYLAARRAGLAAVKVRTRTGARQ